MPLMQGQPDDISDCLLSGQFNYDLKHFTQQELLDYTPEYIYFTEDNIIIRLLEQ